MLIAPLSSIDQRFSNSFLLFVKIYGFFVKSILKRMFSTVYLKQGNISALREKIKQGGKRHPEAINQKRCRVLTGKPTEESFLENKVIVGLHHSSRCLDNEPLFCSFTLSSNIYVLKLL